MPLDTNNDTSTTDGSSNKRAATEGEEGWTTDNDVEAEDVATDPITSDVLKLTQQELGELSLADQEQVVYDLYGFSGPVDESQPGFVEQKMEELQKALDQIPPRRKTAYSMALGINEAYVTNHSFRLQFLRADRFQPSPAATRMVTYFETKLDLFGRDRLCIELTQDDLDPESLEILYMTWFCDLPVRDRAGRQVVVQLSKPGIDCYSLPVTQRMRVLFYTLCVSARDPETQKHGRVALLWVAGSLGKASSLWKIAGMYASSPVRIQGCHLCVDIAHGYSTPIVSIVQLSMNSMLRVRVRRHIGTPQEIFYSLMTYGIPVEFIPIGEDGEFAHQLHTDRWKRIRTQEQWLKQLQQQQQQSFVSQTKAALPQPVGATVATNVQAVDKAALMEKADAMVMANRNNDNNLAANSIGNTTVLVVVDTPTNHDVLMGKGRGAHEHVGNILFRNLIEKCRPQYDAATKTQKTQLAKDIVRIVKEEWKGRFLRDDVKGWIPITDELTIRRKVSVAFRDARKAPKGKKQKQQQAAATEITQEEDELLLPLEDPTWENQPAIDMVVLKA
ncbi:expressed unknown protein [Seminavis robusta]|uniref:DUF6824 domain-containing protein n=1 Tax=Seminavis robusta TaxID=568900 RepID=A0A9N8DLS2_9STRA|nr:expressed unknown protein [Seminavis robusta]|eukprot:Sro213_g088380.1 n/a (560) ;mRNA; f:26744-28423